MSGDVDCGEAQGVGKVSGDFKWLRFAGKVVLQKSQPMTGMPCAGEGGAQCHVGSDDAFFVGNHILK